MSGLRCIGISLWLVVFLMSIAHHADAGVDVAKVAEVIQKHGSGKNWPDNYVCQLCRDACRWYVESVV